MSFAKRFEKLFHNLLPSPFTLAVLLTFAVFGIAVVFFGKEKSFLNHTSDVVSAWYSGIWEGPLLVFAYQMMLILILGHVLALAKPVDNFIRKITRYCDTTPKAAIIVSFFCVLLGLFNWGLALIFGAIFARKIGEYAQQKALKINYPLIGACGYTGLMVWHGGVSGSSLIKVAEEGHLRDLLGGNPDINLETLPSIVGFSETVFSPMNLSVSMALLLVLPFGAYALGKNARGTIPTFSNSARRRESAKALGWAEKLDFHPLLSLILGFSALVTAAAIASESIFAGDGNFVNPNFINTVFLGLGLISHGSLSSFAEAVEEAISGAAGILIQFPLYFGILGMMKSTGMVSAISDFFVSISNEGSYFIFSFLSAGFVNILVPSGGGQWMVQGPIIVEASQEMGLDLGKSILSMAYGDQITNMLQPFWALPLLSITGLKARDILPYTLYFMLIGIVIFVSALLIF